ncbi:MAG TPA: L-threonylcarbamoyladenylate synthase [Alphaproteobacteria bacterium]|jgi:L-threonylcarbamoyladenylate synthase
MTTNVVPATPESIAAAADLLAEGGLVAFPTETVYGLGGDATRERVVARIFAAKGRPRFNPLIVHLAPGWPAGEIAIMDERAKRLAAKFWPGALTLVLMRAPGCPISLLASAGLDTVALRMPAHPVAQALLSTVRLPIAAPSANPSGRLSPTEAQHVVELLGDKVDLILDGGKCPGGLESTVIDLSVPEARILRPGLVTAEEIAAELGAPVPIFAVPINGDGSEGVPAAAAKAEIGANSEIISDDEIKSPGMLASHYAPKKPLRLNARSAEPGEAFLAFGPNPPRSVLASLNLSPAGDLVEAAANLFGYLHRLDASQAHTIAVMPIPEEGLGAAINDRLRRAAAPRP